MADTELTQEQKTQHKAVLTAASHNLDLVIDQLSSLYNLNVDSILESLDSAQSDLAKVKKRYE